jgi:hypothetical protein
LLRFSCGLTSSKGGPKILEQTSHLFQNILCLAKLFSVARDFFLELLGDSIFTLDILEKRTVGAAAGKAGGGLRAAFVVL